VPTRPRIITRSGSNDIKGTVAGDAKGDDKSSRPTVLLSRRRKREREKGRERSSLSFFPLRRFGFLEHPRWLRSALVRDNHALLYLKNHAVALSQRFSIPPSTFRRPESLTAAVISRLFLFRPFSVPFDPTGPEWCTRATASLVYGA